MPWRYAGASQIYMYNYCRSPNLRHKFPIVPEQCYLNVSSAPPSQYKYMKLLLAALHLLLTCAYVNQWHHQLPSDPVSHLEFIPHSSSPTPHLIR